jgi:hypothetical protein
MRLAFIGRKRLLRQAVRQMIDWEPRRVILAHGRWFERDGQRELIRAFDWLLDVHVRSKENSSKTDRRSPREQAGDAGFWPERPGRP